jgi:hypothetical protein
MEAKELLQAANYANTEGKSVRAVNLAKEILERFPDSSEATEAKYLLQNIRHSPTVTNHSQDVVVTRIDIPFLTLVGFMVKWMIAAIPAVIIFMLIMGFILSLLAGLGLSLT